MERTLTFDLAGLQREDGELRSTMEETCWMNAARGGSGEAAGLGSLQFIHNNPVDCKVRGQSWQSQSANTNIFALFTCSLVLKKKLFSIPHE